MKQFLKIQVSSFPIYIFQPSIDLPQNEKVHLFDIFSTSSKKEVFFSLKMKRDKPSQDFISEAITGSKLKPIIQ